MRSGLQMFLPVSAAMLLLAASGTGHAQSVDCRSCHAVGMGAADFSAIYTHAVSHHPTGIVYPLGVTANENFNVPNGQSGGITFFDRNGNGQPDNNEVQLYTVNGAVTVQCSTCHIEHGTAQPSASAKPDVYLRVTNTGSALCSTCHSQ